METPVGNLSEIMRHINGAYTTYFNVKRKRAGHLLQGRYKAILVQADTYATEVSRYIHLNPVRVKIVDKPEKYEWSSYKYFIGELEPLEWLTTSFTLGFFGKKTEEAQKKYRWFVNDQVEREYESPFVGTVASTILGDPDFIEEITVNCLEGREVDRNLPTLRALTKGILMNTIKAEVTAELGDDRLSKPATLYICHRHSGATLKEIGSCHGLGESAVSQASRRFALRVENDGELKRRIEKIEAKLKCLMCRPDPSEQL